MKKLSLFIALLLSAVSIAQTTFTVDGLEYEVTSTNPNEVTLIEGTPLTTDLIIPETVTDASITYTVVAIGFKALSNNNLTSVSIPDSVTVIGDSAFFGNALTTLDLGEGVVTLGESAFENNELTSVSIPDSVMSIGDAAFFKNPLITIDLGEGVVTLGDNVFESNNLTSVSIPDSITSIGIETFLKNALTTIDLGEGLETIGSEAFAESQLTAITLPASVTTIGDRVFNDNPLATITVLATVPPTTDNSSDFNSFGDRSNITVTVPEAALDAYLNDPNWEGFFSINGQYTGGIGFEFDNGGFSYRVTSVAPNEVTIIDTSNSGAIVIPELVTENEIAFVPTVIGDDSLSDKNITSVSIPDTIVEIGTRAFDINELTTVSIPDSVTVIGDSAFFGNALTTLDLGEGIVTIGSLAFRANELTDITLPASVTTISTRAFGGNPLATVTVLATVPPTTDNSVVDNSLNNSFGDRSNITVTVPEAALDAYLNDSNWEGFFSINGQYTGGIGFEFDNGGFSYRVTSVAPNEVTIIDTSNSGAIVIPELVTEIGIAFVPTVIGDESLSEKNITSVNIPDTIVEIGTRAFNINELTTVSIPDSVIEIGNSAFNLNNLSTIDLGEGIEVLRSGIFGNNQLTAITIPASVTSINVRTFGGNPLETITVLATAPPNTVVSLPLADSFGDRSNITVTVPEAEVDAYLNDLFWEGFFSINGQYTGVVPFEFTNEGIRYRFTEAGMPNKVRIIDNFNTGSITIPEVVTENTADFVPTVIGNDAFNGNNISEVIIPNTILEIDNGAFINNPLTTITIPDSVVRIGLDAFKNCTLETVDVGAGLEIIDNGAFLNNDLTSIIIPASVTTIGDGAFNGNSLEAITSLAIQPPTTIANSFGDRSDIALTVPEAALDAYLNDPNWENFFSINGQYTGVVPFEFDKDGFRFRIPTSDPFNPVFLISNTNSGVIIIPEIVEENNVTFVPTSIGPNAFFDDAVTAVTIPNNIFTINENAFANNALTTVILPDNLTSIGSNAFANNELTTVTLPDNLNTIRDNAFANNALITVTLPDNLRQIFNNAFANNALTAVSIPINVDFIDANAFANNNITNLHIEERSLDVDLVIGANAFINNDLTEITFPAFSTGSSSVSLNGAADAFSNNPLETIRAESNDPNTITFNNANDPFDDRSNINLIVPEAALEAYLNDGDWDGFFSTNGQYTGPIPLDFEQDGITYTITGAGDTNTLSVKDTSLSGALTIPDVLTERTLDFVPTVIGVFSLNNKGLTSVSLPNTITTIAQGAFEDNGNLTTITIPNSVTTIEERAFRNNGLTTVDLGEGVETLGQSAFQNNPLTTVTIPDSVTLIDTNAFRGNNITTLDLGEGLVTLGESAFDGNSLATVTIPDSVIEIGRNAFRNNDLETLDLGEGVQVFGPGAFITNQLVDIMLPASVTTIANGVFRNNPLATVTVLATAPPTTNSSSNDNSFGNRSGIDLFVPEDSVTAYTNSGQWDGFNSITEITIDITLAPKVFLQGASLNPIAGEEDFMRDSLRENNLLPTLSPYGDGATVDPTVFTTTGANAIVDWVRVELRTGVDSDNTTIVNSKAALLQRDGDIVDLDGSSNITFTEEDGDYFIAIIHRNHIGILAAVPAPLSNQATALDFTQDVTSAKGENLALTTLVNGTFAMIAGDADGSSQILNTDIIEALTLAGGGEAYATADADMNGFVLNSDIQLLVLANSGTVQQFE